MTSQMIKRVLIVDDDSVIRQMLGQLLQKEYIRTFSVSSAEEALAFLDRCDQDHIQVILSDIKLPGMDGLEFCRKIRRKEPLIVMIALTGYADLYTICRCREAGFDDYLNKPFSMGVLKAALIGAFKRARYWETLVRRNLQEPQKRKPISGVDA